MYKRILDANENKIIFIFNRYFYKLFNKNFTYLLIIILFSFTPSINAKELIQTTYVFPSNGIINYPVQVYVNFNNITLENTLLIGAHDGRPYWTPTQQLLMDLAKDANLRMLRLLVGRWHIFSLEPCSYWNETTRTGTYNWSEIDKWIEAIKGIGMEPLLCIGGQGALPIGMSEKGEHGFPLYVDDFAKHCSNIVYHLNIEKGYNVKYWEIWNEATCNDEASVAQFTEIYNIVQLKMHSEDPSILCGNDRCLIPRFVDYYVDHIHGLNFASFHKYDTGDPNESKSELIKRASDLINTWREPQSWYRHYSPREAKDILGVQFIICSETNIDWDAPDLKHNTMFQEVWYAEELRAFILDGTISYSLFFCYAGALNSYSMVNCDPPFTVWHPYYVNYLIGNNLNRGDNICESFSDNQTKVTTLAWKSETQKYLLLIGKTPKVLNVNIKLIENVSETIILKKITNISEFEGKIEMEKILYMSPLIITLDGYTVVLLIFDY